MDLTSDKLRSLFKIIETNYYRRCDSHRNNDTDGSH